MNRSLFFFIRVIRSYSNFKLLADLDNPNSILRKPALEVHFPLGEEEKFLCEMLKQALKKEKDALGFALPQFGVSKRIIILSIPYSFVGLGLASSPFPPSIFINPKIKPIPSYGKEGDWEVCYSDRYYTAWVERFRQVEYEAYDENGVRFSGRAEGILARLLQHETDHLDGVMSKDVAKKYSSLEKIYGLSKVESKLEYSQDIEIPAMVKRHN